MISADDDMRPHALIEDSPESLRTDEISRGKLLKPNAGGIIRKSFDLLTSFHELADVLQNPLQVPVGIRSESSVDPTLAKIPFTAASLPQFMEPLPWPASWLACLSTLGLISPGADCWLWVSSRRH